MSLVVIAVSLLAFIATLSVHEFSHALAGYFLGDETAARHGRLTLNPIAHIDAVGTIVLPLIGAISGLPVIGWAKPVPFNPYNLKYAKWGSVIVALAGPVSNIIVASVSLVALRILLGLSLLSLNNLLVLFLVYLAVISLALAIFNFFPIAPLDGSRLVTAIFDGPKHEKLRHFLETRGPLILLLVIVIDFASPISFLDKIFGFVIGGFFSLFGLAGLF